ncbi:Gamma-tubulin complex component 3 [Chlorella vulgaris]
MSIPERLLVLDALQAASGLNGRYAATSLAAELGWLLKRTEAELEQSDVEERDDGGGGSGSRAVEQPSPVYEALLAAARREVSNYYRLLAVLEAQAQRQSPDSADGGSLTLRRLTVWLSEPLGRLRILAGCLEAARDAQGGQMVNILHALSKHGDPLVRQVACPLLEEVCVPYFKQVGAWVLGGTLDTASDDFMVSKEQLVPPHCDDPAAAWRGGHRLNAGMQPTFLSNQLAANIFTTGKTIAFLREWCGDTRWAAAISTTAKQLATAGGTYQQLRWLETAVGEVHVAVSSHLLDIVMQHHGLPRHLAAVKRFLLLGQGDFVRVLLDAAQHELDKGAKDVSQYTLQGHLDAALRSSSAANEDADVLRRVDVRLPPGKVLEGDLGWDIFSLQYLVDGPMRAVLSPDAMSGYLRIFRLLWAVKHVEVVLEQSWSTINSTQRVLNVIREQERMHGVAVNNAELVPHVLRAFHAYRAEMASFVTSLQYYIVFEVLEPNWTKLMSGITVAADLDAVIALHEGTLQAIATGMFLDGLPQTLTPLGVGGAGAPDVQAGLRKTLRAVLDVQVFNSPTIPTEVLQEINSSMARVHALYHRHLRTFLTLLPAQSHLDLSMFMARCEQ